MKKSKQSVFTFFLSSLVDEDVTEQDLAFLNDATMATAIVNALSRWKATPERDRLATSHQAYLDSLSAETKAELNPMSTQEVLDIYDEQHSEVEP